MADGRHTSAGDRSFAASVARNVVAGLALVGVVSVVFWGIGQLDAADGAGNPVITAPSDEPAALASPTESTEPPPPPVTAEEPTPTPTPTPTPSPTATATAEIEPSEVTVQVLDAAGDDGSAAEDATGRLREAGYVVVAENAAVRMYERSTLFYTEGHEAEARAIAEVLTEFDVIEEKPDNLSSEVDVHAVVGADWFAPGD